MEYFNLGSDLHADFEWFGFFNKRPIEVFKSIESKVNSVSNRNIEDKSGDWYRIIFFKYLEVLERYYAFKSYNTESIGLTSSLCLIYSSSIINKMYASINEDEIHQLLDENHHFG